MSYTNADQIRAQIRSSRGETIDLAVPRTCTVGQLRQFLIQQYQYAPTTVFTFNNAVISDERYIEEFPYGSLYITSTTSPADPGYGQSQQTNDARYNNNNNNNREPAPQAQQNYNNNNNNNSQQRGNRARQTQSKSSRKSTSQQQHEQENDWSNQQGGDMYSTPQQQQQQQQGENVSAERHGKGGESRKPQSTPSHRKSSVHSNDSAPHIHVSRTPATLSPATTPRANMKSAGGKSPSSQSKQRQDANTTVGSGAEQDKEPSSLYDENAVICVHAVCPALDSRVVTVTLPIDATVGDLLLALVAQEPELVGGRLLYCGKPLTGTDTRLFNFGIRPTSPDAEESNSHGVTVWVASGAYNSLERVLLLQIETEVENVSKYVESHELTTQERKGYYEELMRALLKTDGLQDLEGEWRQRRRDTVKRITALQDKLKITEQDIKAKQ